MSEERTPGALGSNDGLGQLLEDWADAACAVFHHGETLRGVSRDDLLQLMRAVQAAERERNDMLRTVAGQVLRDMRAQDVLIEWQTPLEEALKA